jgi:hypothetical protein
MGLIFACLLPERIRQRPSLALFACLLIRLFQLVFFSRNSIFLSQQISEQYFQL